VLESIVGRDFLPRGSGNAVAIREIARLLFNLAFLGCLRIQFGFCQVL
jgi:hypothetical protein